jgi:phosphopantothenate-cysteine ligase
MGILLTNYTEFDSSTTSVPVHFLLEISFPRFSHISQGTRGATSAEYFLKAGYAVIFMHRQFSLQPFSRHYSHSTNPFLDFLDIEPCSPSPSPNHNPDPDTTTTTNFRISVTPNKRQDLLRVLSSYKRVHALGLLHTLSFVTVNDYLWLLRALSQELAVLKRNSLFYLAAAVSDFFLPRQKLVST